MGNKKSLMKGLICGVLLSGSILVQAQTNLFKNGGLAAEDGKPGTVAAGLPKGWIHIPTNISYAYSNGQSFTIDRGKNTTDLTGNLTDSNGIYIKQDGTRAAYGGDSSDKETSTFVSGLFGIPTPTSKTVFFHETIVQQVSGLEVGKTYTLSFMQAIVQQTNGHEKKGQWRIYAGATPETVEPIAVSPVISITEDRIGNVAKPIKPLVWEKVTLDFVPTSESMAIGFGAWHPDEQNYTGKNGYVRMGIDDIWLYRDEPSKACFKDANTSGAGLETNHGITLLQRAGKSDWPTIRKGAWTALESNTKGLVITRMTTAQVNAISNPQEGMMTYDTDEKCLKLYDGTKWSCFATPSCPTSY